MVLMISISIKNPSTSDTNQIIKANVMIVVIPVMILAGVACSRIMDTNDYTY